MALFTAEQELALLRQQHEALLRAIAHDLRAPLRHVNSFAPLLMESVQELAQAVRHDPSAQQVAEDALEFAQHMQQGAQRMAQMVEALTQLSRAARAHLQLQPVDAVALCQAAWHDVLARQPHYAQAHLHLPGTPVLVQADAQALAQVWQELLANACKFAAPRAQIHLSAQRQAHGRWQLQLQDNGVGFDGTRAQALFQPFARMHRDSEFPGLGCGLALAQALAQRQGAQLSIAAQPGQGCTVLLDWPAALPLPTP